MIPPQSPRGNAYTEWFLLTGRTEVTDRTLIFGERHFGRPRRICPGLQRTNPNRSRQLRLPRPDESVADLSQERVKRRHVLGSLINEYQ